VSLVNEEQSTYDSLQVLNLRVPAAKGILETVRLLERGKARVVIIAQNVDPPDRLNVVRDLCSLKGVRIVVVPDKERLGRAVGLDVGTSCVALRADIE
jgi:large subunit ribosomal protein L7Ae